MELKVVIDRFEGNIAVLLFEESDWQVSWPRELLPPQAQQGDYVTIEMAIDRQATSQAQARATDLLRRVMEQNK